MVRVTFSVWMHSGYAHTIVIVSVVIVARPVFSQCSVTRSAWGRSAESILEQRASESVCYFQRLGGLVLGRHKVRHLHNPGNQTVSGLVVNAPDSCSARGPGSNPCCKKNSFCVFHENHCDRHRLHIYVLRPNFLNKLNISVIPGTSCFYGNWVEDMPVSSYLVILLAAAWFVAAPAAVAVSPMCDSA